MWVCENKCKTDTVIAYDIPMEFDPDGCGVQINKFTGNATDMWGDGKFGVSKEVKVFAVDDEYPRCPECGRVCKWKVRSDS